MSSSAGSSSAHFQSFSSPLRRALSPLVVADAVAQASAIDGDSFLKISDRRAGVLGLARSLDDILKTITVDYQTVLVPFLRKVHDYAERRVSLTDQLAVLEKHKAAGTLPSSLASVRSPVFQLGKEYLKSCPVPPPQLAEIDTLVSTTRLKALDYMIDAMRGELAWYEAQLSAETLIPYGVRQVDERYTSHIEPNGRVPTFESITLPNGQTESRIVENSWAVSPSIIAARTRQVEVIPRLIYTVLALVQNKKDAVKQKQEAKKQLKDAADVAMGNAEDPSEVFRKDLAELRKQIQAMSTSKRGKLAHPNL
ncbi:hypothetical protein BDY19DRAFT_904810 [Irpex rosettiformis]|uniref:Uncharacterized protein n=1 Tax=Irpex rosettiformis TaxID=378272 RepID=A0ACB8U8Q3_9APHY|nr:hypothetical protein BDY19DRAFT_904810 [Irpex rosettiformis]